MYCHEQQGPFDHEPQAQSSTDEGYVERLFALIEKGYDQDEIALMLDCE